MNVATKAMFRFMMINENILTAIYHNISIDESYKLNQLDIYEFCSAVSNFIEERSQDNISTGYLLGEVSMLETHNSHIEVIEKLMKLEFML